MPALGVEYESVAVSPAWEGALRALDCDLRRRAASKNTLDAYRSDCRQLAVWACAAGLEPAAIDMRALRRYVAGLSSQGQAPGTVARKLAAARALFRVQMQQGERAENPADLIAAPKRPKTLPHVLKQGDAQTLLERIPANTPLEQRDRALFELAYSSGLRAEELVSVEVGSIDFDAEAVRVEGKGGKTRVVPIGEYALWAISRYLERARPALRGGAVPVGPGAAQGAD
jgi:site-specific recombinase XerD